jgi:hypothetical protein
VSHIPVWNVSDTVTTVRKKTLEIFLRIVELVHIMGGTGFDVVRN